VLVAHWNLELGVLLGTLLTLGVVTTWYERWGR
jgi:hypothetical protein